MSALLHLVEAATALSQLVVPSNLLPQHTQAASSTSSMSTSPQPNVTAVPFTYNVLSQPLRPSTHNISDDDDMAAIKMATLRENHMQALRIAAANAGLSAAQPMMLQHEQPAAPPAAVMRQEPMMAPPAAMSMTSFPQQVNTTCAASVAASVDGSKELFPMRLHALLSDPTVRDVISWLPHGKSFVVLRPDVFAMRVLPRYFAPEGSNSLNAKTTTVVGRDGCVQIKNKSPGVHKYPSFTRKLNRWGFRQISRGPDAGAFCHEMFQRDGPELSRGMVCQKSRKSPFKRISMSSGGMMDDMISVSSASTMSNKPSATLGEKRPFSSTVTVSTAGATSNKSLPFKKRKSGQMNSFMMNDIPSMISHRPQKMAASTSSVTEIQSTNDHCSVVSNNTSLNSSVKAPVPVSAPIADNPGMTAEAAAMEALARHFHEQHRAFALASLIENSRLAMQAAGMKNQAALNAVPTASSPLQETCVTNQRRKCTPALGAATTHPCGAFAPTVSIPEEKKMPAVLTPATSISSADAAKSALYKAYLQALNSAPSS